MSDEEFLRQFEDCSLPPVLWTHRAHLKVGYLYLMRYPFNEAMERLRAALRAYNSVRHVPESLSSGYHETMTRAWLHLIQVTLAQYGHADSADAFIDAQPQLCQKQVLRFFYSRDCILSAEAKASFVAPDLAPLPRAVSSGLIR